MTAAAPKIVAVLDACVLYPPSLRDLLLWLATVEAYEPRWTEEIHGEWTRNVLADHPDVTPAQLDRTRRLMSQAVPKGLVSGYEARIPLLSLPDADDRHVLAAAIEAGAAVIVTSNLSDFPAATLGAHGVDMVLNRCIPTFFFRHFLTVRQLCFCGGCSSTGPPYATRPRQRRTTFRH